MPSSQPPLPPLPQTKNRQADGNYTFNNGAIVLTPKQLVDLLDQNGGSASKAAKSIGVKEVSTLSTWGDQARKKLLKLEEEKAKRDEATKKIFEGVFKKVSDQYDVMKKAREESSWFFKATTSKTFNSINSDLNKLVALQQKSPEILEQMVSGITHLGDKYDEMIKKQTNQKRYDEENRLENNRKFGNDGGYLANSLGMGNSSGKKFDLESAMDSAGGLIFGLLFDPKLITSYVASMGLTKIIGASLRSPLLLAATAGAMAIGDAFNAYAQAEDWDVSGMSAAIGGFLGGDAKGGLMNALAGAGKWGLMGAQIGLIGGLPGMIAGALVGAAVGGILGWFGAQKIAETMDTIVNSLTGWSDHLLGTAFGKTEEQLKGEMAIANEALRVIRGATDRLTERSAQLQLEIEQARNQGNTALVDSLTAEKTALDQHVSQLTVDAAVNQKGLNDATRDLEDKQKTWWRFTDNLISGAQNIWDANNEHLDIINAEFNNLKTNNAAWWSENDALSWTDKTSLWMHMAISTSWDQLTTGIGGAITAAGVKAIEGADWIKSGFDNLMNGLKSWWDGLLWNLNPMNWVNGTPPENINSTVIRPTTTMPDGTIVDSNPMMSSSEQSSVDQNASNFVKRSPVELSPAIKSIMDSIGSYQQNKPELPQQFQLEKFLKDARMKEVIAGRSQLFPQSQANPQVAPLGNGPRMSTVNTQNITSVNNNTILNAGFSAVDSTFFGGR